MKVGSELLAPDAQRVLQDQARRLLLAAEPAFGSFVIVVRQRRTFFKQLAHPIHLQSSRQRGRPRPCRQSHQTHELAACAIACRAKKLKAT
jgi:hypothetical protein